MHKNYTFPLIVAAGMLGIMAGPSVVVAADQVQSKTEKQAKESQSAINDAWLHGKLESALLFNEHLDSFAIDTDVKNSTAYLRGAVESDIDRDLAGEIAKSIKGVSAVENELVVDKKKAAMSRDSDAAKERQGFKQSVSNATLTARIKTQLLMNGNTGGMAIDVDSDQGSVTLSGEVKSDEEKDLAMKLAENTSGATSVTDRLVVKSN
jgi:osmotically-inducible protein OsmY